MKKLLVVAGMLMFSTTVAGAEEVKATEVCKGQDQRCTETCDLDKVLWIFKGEAHANCMQRCDEKIDACLAEDLDVDTFEVILPRSAYGERDARDVPSLQEREVEAGNT